jgi:hypothetical protein
MTTDHEYKLILHAALSTRGYTPAGEFVPRLEERVPRDLIFKLLSEMQADGQAELCYGVGWRAVEQEPATNPDERMVYENWKHEVADGLTVLGYTDWVHNRFVAHEVKEGRL